MNNQTFRPVSQRKQAGFVIGMMLYMLMLIGVGSGVIYSCYSQLLISQARSTNSLTIRNDLNASGVILAATSVLSRDSTHLCPPRSIHQGPDVPCNAAPVKLLQFADMGATDIPKLPKNSALVVTTGAPTEAGVFISGTGLKQLDPYGRFYIYCRWENARSNGAAPAFVLLSAGADGTLQTKCGDTGAKGDDSYNAFSVGIAIQRAAVWQVGSSDNVTYGATGTQVNVGADGVVAAQGLSVSNEANFGGDVTAQNLIVVNTATFGGDAIGSSFYNPTSPTLYSTSFGWFAGGLGAPDNTAFGVSALQDNTTGHDNAAFGAWAMQQNTTGYFNAAFGMDALGSNTTGLWNSAFGQNALSSNTTGNSNSSFGQASLNYSTTGLNNSAFGTGTLFNDTTGSGNVALGYWTAATITTGNSNTCLGTGTCSTVLTTGSNDILIGNLQFPADTPASNTSNFLNIGNLIYGNLTSGSVGINVTSPAAALDVKGGVKVGNDTSSCNGSRAGEIKFSGAHFYGCNGSAWLAFTAT